MVQQQGPRGCTPSEVLQRVRAFSQMVEEQQQPEARRVGQQAKMLLIGKTIGHIMIESCSDTMTNKKFNIRHNVLKVVTQDAFSTGNTDMVAGECSEIFCDI